jgi:O-antigen ligase
VAERLGHTAASDDIYGSGVSEDNLDQSARYRLILWRAGFGMMQDYPLLGVGLQRFARVVEAYTEIPLGPNDPRDAHNAYILMAAELGIPMFLLMATLLLTLLGTAVYVYLKRQDPVDRTLGLSMAGTVVAVIVSCMFGSRFSDEGLIGYFWLMSALLISVRRMPVESQGKETTA